MKKSLFTVLFSLITLWLSAQETIEMADKMRSNGKIYVVVCVVVVILIGLFIYLFSIDRKVKRLEKKIKH